MPIEIKLIGKADDTFGKVYHATQEAIAHARQPVKLVTLDDPVELERRGVEVSPALVVNERVLATGRVPEAREIVTWIMNAALAEDPH